MKEILELLRQSLKANDATTKEALLEGIVAHIDHDAFEWILNYPTALIHDKKASSESKLLSELQKQLPSENIRSIDLMVLSENVKTLTFNAKRPHDFWKRLSSVEHIQAMLSLLSVSSASCEDLFIQNDLNQSPKGQWSVETALRDAMRANKENRDLGLKPFIIVVSKENLPESVDHMYCLLEHYFGENVEVILSKDKKTNYYLAYHEHMGEIGMRYFYRFAS